MKLACRYAKVDPIAGGCVPVAHAGLPEAAMPVRLREAVVFIEQCRGLPARIGVDLEIERVRGLLADVVLLRT